MCMRQQGKSGTNTWHNILSLCATCARERPAQGHDLRARGAQGMERNWAHAARGGQGHGLCEGCARIRLARGVREDILASAHSGRLDPFGHVESPDENKYVRTTRTHSMKQLGNK